jgi:lipopolysaccharide transport system ATP-binding protein
MNTVIKAENISKKYILSHQRKGSYQSLREATTDTVKRWGRKISRISPKEEQDQSHEKFWALKDISFEVRAGERVGIIGRNGAGKSTILKILSRITEPTEGKVTICGRVSSLLEVGTGFHPELSGRENIYLNGAILGMSRSEINNKFDEIVTFAEMEKFLDTPVKRYSSGMYVRLAFAVAAHLEPEILIVDEVLSVGDAQFQKKCLGKIEDVSQREGRTVLFVSHNMQAIRQLCSRAIVLCAGEIVVDDSSSAAIERYLREGNQIPSRNSLKEVVRNLHPDPSFEFEDILLRQGSQMIESSIENGKPLEIEIHYKVKQKTTGLRVYADLYDDQGILLFRSFNDEDSDGIPSVDEGRYVARVIIPADLLAPIRYILKISGTIFNVRTFYPDGISVSLTVERTGKANRAYLVEPIRGKLAPVLHWETIMK